MPEHRRTLRHAGAIALACLCLIASGCTLGRPEPPPAPTVVEVPETPPPVVTPVEIAPELPAEPPPPPPPPPPVALLVSSDIEPYRGVERSLVNMLGGERTIVVRLEGDPGRRSAALSTLAESRVERVIAIGALAADVATESSAEHRLFCQILNFEARDLLSATSGGVKLLPPFRRQLGIWRSLSPELRSVGVISGPGQDALIDEIREATAELGVALHVRIARSDKEALYLFKRMTPGIDGFWLLPDNRVLSPGVIRGIMTYGGKHQKQIVVFNDKLLALGALMSVTGDPDDVARQALRLLEQAERGAAPIVVPLTRMQVQINPDAVGHLDATTAQAEQDTAGRR